MTGFTETVLFLGIVATMYGQLCMADCSTDSTCSGHGTCEADKTCTCDNGYIGDLCQHDDPCHTDPCNGKGTCAPDTSDPSKGVCTCKAGYGGDKCDLVSCTNNPCLNEGACEVKDGNIECTCAPGWVGDRCADASGAATISGHFLLLTVVAVLAKLNLN